MKPLNSIAAEPISPPELLALVEERREIVYTRLACTPIGVVPLVVLLDLVFVHNIDFYLADPWGLCEDFDGDQEFRAAVAAAFARFDWHLGTSDFLQMDIRANFQAHQVLVWQERRLAT